MTLVMGFPAAAFRARFPVLERSVHLAACSLAPRSSALDAALSRMLEAMGGDGLAWPRFEEEAERARQAFAGLIGARADQVALVPSASVGAYQAASALDFGERSRVVTSEEEFPSIAHVWLAQEPRGADVVFTGQAPADGTAEATADAYRAAIDERAALVSVPLVSYRTGMRLPAEEVAALAHDAGARVLVDAYQAAGVLPVDVGELGCDFLIAGAMKYLLGLPGLAFLYVRDGVPGDRDPTLTGWFGRVDPFAFDPRRLDFPAAARRYETGTAAVPALYGANAGLGMVAGLDLDEVRRHVAYLVGLASERLDWQGEQVTVAKDPRSRGPALAIAAERPGDLADWLAARGVVVSPRGGLVRLAFHFYSDESDVEAVCAAVRSYRWANGGGR